MMSDWQDRYEHLIELGKELPLIASEKKTEQNIVRGCQSRVWLDASLVSSSAALGLTPAAAAAQQPDTPVVHYTADSDAMITKGLISLLVRVLNDRKPEEILNTPITFIDQIGLREHLSPNRANGLSAMLDQMKRYALAFSTMT